MSGDIRGGGAPAGAHTHRPIPDCVQLESALSRSIPLHPPDSPHLGCIAQSDSSGISPPMRLPTMSGNFLLAPIPETADYFTVRDIKMAVMGAGGVGKTAMIVRFLTKRFIGDYESNTGNLYSRLVAVEGEHMALQIQDTPGYVKVEDDVSQVADMLRFIQSSEGFLLVYSVTDLRSYEYIRHLHQHIRKVHSDSKIPIIIVANKGDLLHVRQVPSDSGIQLANELGCSFVEISTSENCQDVCDVFHHLCKVIGKHQSSSTGEKRRGSVMPRPKSPNMQDLKRRFKQALSPKIKASSAMA